MAPERRRDWLQQRAELQQGGRLSRQQVTRKQEAAYPESVHFRFQ